MHLCTVKTAIWQICSNRPGKKVPQIARLSAGGGGCNRYLGIAQIEVTLFKKGLPLYVQILIVCEHRAPTGQNKAI